MNGGGGRPPQAYAGSGAGYVCDVASLCVSVF